MFFSILLNEKFLLCVSYFNLQYLIIITCCYICFGCKAALDGEFVFDDNVAIKKNADINTDTPLEQLFKNDFWGGKLDNLRSVFSLLSVSHPNPHMSLPFSHKSYRPLTILTFRLENHLYGLNPFYMKIVNLILHSICSCLVYFVSKAIFTDDAVSFYASVTFAVHPIHTEVRFDQ